MSRHKPLDAVATVRRQHENAAARDLAAAQARHAAEQQRLTELQGYLREYESAPAKASVHWLANRARFLARLQEAVQAQRQRLQEAEAALEAGRTRHLLARRDRKVLQRLQAAYARADARDAERRAQSTLDDWSAARHGDAVA
jgi:flagellar export protein FliJ